MKEILVIDNNEDILQNITEILELSNYKVTGAADGKTGIEQAIKSKPDLILCDIMMPELDGYGVLHMVQKNPELEQTPFIFVTTKTTFSEIRKGMSLGADDYITKPFDITDLLNSVETRLKKAELIKKRITIGIESENKTVSFSRGEQILRKFVEGGNVNYYKKRQRIFSENNHSLCLYYVQKGRVKVFKTNDEGKEFILRICNEGEFFGYLALLEDSFYKEYANALEDCELVTVPRNDFFELMQSYPQVTQIFIKLLATQLSQNEDRLIQIAYNSLRKKVANALLSLKETFKGPPSEFTIRISRENLSALAGTATESLIRTLSDFKSEKLIDIKDVNISILNEDKLRKLTN